MGAWTMACLKPCLFLILFLDPHKRLAVAQALLCVPKSGLDPCSARLYSLPGPAW